MKANFGLKNGERADLVNDLNRLLANTFSLYINTLNGHWNVEDPRFMFLHEMLEDQYTQLSKNCDEIAERIRQMGEKVRASLQFFQDQSEIKELGSTISADQLLEELGAAHEKLIQELRELTSKAENYGDYGLVDLLGGLLRFHEKTAWMIRSHL